MVRKKILNFFHRFRFFHLDTFWYNDRCWKPSPGATLDDSNDGLDISHDLKKFLYKILANQLFAFQMEKFNFFFKNRKSTSTWLRSMNHYYESKVHALKMFLSYFYDIQYPKHFPSFFWLQNENYAIFITVIKIA